MAKSRARDASRANHYSIRLEWTLRPWGAWVSPGGRGRLKTTESPPTSPGVYVFVAMRENVPQEVYVGESYNLSKRFGYHANGRKGRSAWLRGAIKDGCRVSVFLVQDPSVDDSPCRASFFDSKLNRVALEGAVIQAALQAGRPVANKDASAFGQGVRAGEVREGRTRHRRNPWEEPQRGPIRSGVHPFLRDRFEAHRSLARNHNGRYLLTCELAEAIMRDCGDLGRGFEIGTQTATILFRLDYLGGGLFWIQERTRPGWREIVLQPCFAGQGGMAANVRRRIMDAAGTESGARRTSLLLPRRDGRQNGSVTALMTFCKVLNAALWDAGVSTTRPWRPAELGGGSGLF